MTDQLKILSAQLNPCVGDVSGNMNAVRSAFKAAIEQDADVLAFPELFVLGYPPEDLVLKPAAVDACMEAVEEFLPETRNHDIAVVLGTPWREHGQVFNSALVIHEGKISGRHDKVELPNYGVFDEKRVFQPGRSAEPVSIKGVSIGLAICEDIWFESVPRELSSAGAELLIVPNGSPWRRTIQEERRDAFSQWSYLKLPYLFVNQVGGQDELVFDGASFARNIDGKLVQQLPDFQEALSLSTWRRSATGWNCASVPPEPLSESWEAEYRAAVLALADYVNKNRFPGVVIGLSGGIDSALTAAMAVDALGSERVWCIMMPSRYTSDESLEDAKACAQALGVRYDILSIAPGIEALDQMLVDHFAGMEADTTEENIQSRLRGMTLMALSNKFGHMVLTTGNKSEMAVGYATLYGDMCGGYNALKDFYKTEVFALSRWRNAHCPKGALGPAGQVIPERIITKPPTAELRDDQKDEDSLPPYEVLDDILRSLVDEEADLEAVLARGHDEATVRRIEHLVYLAEYKRRQAPPGVKVGGKNFGRDRRYPITNRFRDD